MFPAVPPLSLYPTHWGRETGRCSTTLNASDVVRSDTTALPCVGSPEQGCGRVRWALECELTLQANESEEMGMKMPLGTCVNRRWGKEGLWPSETLLQQFFTLATGCSPRHAPTPQ